MRREVKSNGVDHLGQATLARRWGISPRTLERWRWLGNGPAYLKIGSRVAYRVEDVEAYEVLRIRSTQAGDDQAEQNELASSAREKNV